MTGLDKYELIDQYLEGTLSVQEQARFDSMLSSDPALAEEVELQRIANSLIVENKLANIKTRLRENHFGKQKPSSDPRSGTKGWIIGSVLVLLSAIALFFILHNKKPESKALLPTQPNETLAEKQPEVKPLPSEADKNKPMDTTSSAAAAPVPEEKKKVTAIPEVKKEENKTPSGKSEMQIQKIADVEITGNCYLTFSRNITINPSCAGRSSGSIAIDPKGISGGTMPYEIFINGNKLTNPYIYSNVPAGKYLMTVKDAGRSCTDSLEISVPVKKFCKE